MKNRGFTLIELLAVLVIIPLLMIIAYPAVNSFLKQTTAQYYDNLEKNVRLAAIDFAQDNRNFLPKSPGGYKRITIEQIVKYGELEQITDKDGNVCESGYVVIKKNDTADYEYTSCVVCGDYQTTNPTCEKNDSRYEVNYVLKHNDQNGATYEEDTWSGTNIYQEFTNNQLYGVRVDTYQRQLDDSAWEDFSGNSFILESTRKVCVRAIDIDGNISDVSCYNVKIDKNPITVTSKAETFEYEYKSTDYNNTNISDLFTFGSFGPSGGTITCQAGSTVFYENDNGTIKTNKKVSSLGLAKTTSVTCKSTTGAKISRSATTTIKIVARSITTLDANGGSVTPSSIEVIYGEKYNLPTPTRTGYTFDGWYTAKSGGTKISNTTTVDVTEAQTLYAHWTANEYTITFDSTGGSLTATTKKVTYDSTYGDLPNPTRVGYTFAGWYTEKTGGTKITSSTTVKITENQTLYAHWTANEYKVTFDANGGSVSLTTKEVTYGSKYGDLPTPTKTGYIFDGWYTAKSGGTQITETSLVQIVTEQTLYAHWRAAEYTVTFNPNGGSVDPTSKKVTYDSTYGTLPTPERTGYTFAGWYTAKSGGTKITSSATVKITENKTYYAHWTANEYTYNIVYKSNSGVKLGTSTATYEYGTTNTISPKSFTGYTSPSSQSVKWDSTTAKTITFTYTPTNYSISYTLNNGTNPSTAKKSYTIEDAVTLPTPTRTGYTFAGWYTSSSFSGSKVTSIAKGTTGNKTYYAKWTTNEYTYNIVYQSSSGVKLGTSTATYEYGTTNTISPKSFTGYTSPSSQSVKWDSTTAKTITFTYTPISYSISYTLNNGTNPSTAKTSYTIEDAVTLPTPTRTGYTFAGWYTSSSFSGSKVTSIAKGTTGNKTYYAKWTSKEYTYNIVYQSNSGTELGTSTATYEYGTTNTISPKSFTGYTSPDSQSVKWDSTTAKTITFTYTPTSYSISYTLNSGTNPSTAKTSYTIEDAVTLPTPTRSGYTFDGWYTSSSFSGSKVTSIAKGTTGNKTYYAKWKSNNYDAEKSVSTYAATVTCADGGTVVDGSCVYNDRCERECIWYCTSGCGQCYDCPADSPYVVCGCELDGGKWVQETAPCYEDCQKTDNTKRTYTCPKGGTLNGTTCEVTTYSCPNGGTLSGKTCVF